MKSIGGIVLIVLVALLGWWLVNSQPNVPAPAPGGPTDGQPGTVVYSADGFTPSEVEISVGDTLIFHNDSARLMWVKAVDAEGYPEFNQERGTAKDTSYEFIFSRAGTWEYRNEEFAEHTGRVVVR